MYRFFLSLPTPKAADDGPSSPSCEVQQGLVLPSGVTRTTVLEKLVLPYRLPFTSKAKSSNPSCNVHTAAASRPIRFDAEGHDVCAV